MDGAPFAEPRLGPNHPYAVTAVKRVVDIRARGVNVLDLPDQFVDLSPPILEALALVFEQH